MRYKTAMITDIGNVRERNEDSLLLCRRNFGKQEALLAAVADGMGGLSHGERASRFVIENLKKWWEESVETMANMPEIFHIGDMLGFIIEKSHVQLCEEMQRLQTNMGTTLSLVFLWKNEYVLQQVGDSRIYLLDKKAMYQLTIDQTWCQEEVMAGRMTKEEMAAHQMRHVLSNALGVQGKFYVKTQIGQLRTKQRLLLCSDGYYTHLKSKELKRKLFFGNMQKQLDKSCERIRKGAAEDNLTAILIEA